MKNVLRLVFASIIFLICLPSPAQAQKGEIKGKIIDNASKKPLPYATVAVYRAQDTTLVTFRVSDDKGLFKTPGLPLEVRLRVVVSMTGFGVYRKELTLTPTETVADLGEVIMGESAKMLSEVLVTAEVPPIVVRKDTLEFNAASFKTLPTALVEDLLKKLPGVAVDNAGNISVNGKAVNKILVDGKEFFGDDPKVASRNLPADVIEKVQVMNDPDALRRNPDMPANDIPQVINLKFKKGIKKGAFGKLYVGGGQPGRYEGGGILNIFKDTMQVSVLGYSNNLNRPGFGFEDISRIGGFNRSGINSMMIRSDGGFALNDISFGGTQEGIQQSSGGGANFNTILHKKIKLNLLYFFGNINADLNQLTNSNQVLPNQTLNTRRTRDQTSQNFNHKIGGRLDWQLSELTKITITPSVTWAASDSRQNARTLTTEEPDELINQSDNDQRMDNGASGFSTNLALDQLFNKKGRQFNIYGNYSLNTTLNNQYNNAINTFYRPQPFTSLLNQLRENDQSNLFIQNSLNFTEPLTKNISAVLRVNSRYFDDHNILNTYNAASDLAVYDIPVPELSDFIKRQGWRNGVTTGLRWRIKELSINPGLEFNSIAIQNQFQKSPQLNQNFAYIRPALSISWKEFYASYNTYVEEPFARYLQPVIDNTNPLFIQYGNPTLQPSVDNRFYLSYRKYDTKRLLNYNVYLNGGNSKNGIVQERTLNSEGVQTARPVNANGIWQVSTYGSVMKDYKFNDKNQFSIGTNFRVSYNKNLVLLNNLKSDAVTWGLYPSIEGRMNLDNKIELTQNYSISGQRSTYEKNTFDNRHFITRNWRSEIIVRLPRKLVWESQLDYRYNSNTVPGVQKSFYRINAAVTYLFLKNDRGQLKFAIYDLLNQNISNYRLIRENMIEDYQTTVLNRYGLVSFTYNIRNFGGKVGGTNSMFRF
ncbi:MAG: outer membrane beta-barrel protein [Adhaeribacter sp.]